MTYLISNTNYSMTVDTVIYLAREYETARLIMERDLNGMDDRPGRVVKGHDVQGTKREVECESGMDSLK